MVRAGYKETPKGMIPEEWAISPLSVVGPPKMCKRVLKDQTSSEGDIPFYKIGTFGKEADAFISRSLFEAFKSRFSYPKKGDVLLSAAGTIGRTVVFDGREAYFQDSNIVWIDNDEQTVLNAFLYYCYHIIKWQTADGGTVSRLYNALLSSTLIAYPTLKDEQVAIVSALSDIDKLIADLEKLIEKKKNIQRGVMQELLTGKKRLHGFKGAWRECTIADVAYTASGGTPSRDNPEYYTGNIRWVTTGELADSFIYNTNEHITAEAVAHSSAKIFPSGTLLIAMYGATIGKLGILKNEAATNQACCAIIPLDICDGVSTDFLFYWLLYHRKRIVEMGCGAGQPNISQKIIKEIRISFPTTTGEQTAITSILRDTDEEMQQLLALHNKYSQIQQGMMQKLLTGDIRLV